MIDCCVELGRQLLLTYMEAERVFSWRKNESGGKDYYVKWRNLPYNEATWEDEFNVTNYYTAQLDAFNDRLKSKNCPKNYKDSMKNVS